MRIFSEYFVFIVYGICSYSKGYEFGEMINKYYIERKKSAKILLKKDYIIFSLLKN